MLVCQRQCSVSEEMMEKVKDDGLRTVECLRGRLQAERVASKSAKDEAENLSKKLDDLEKKLAEEMKCKKRADKRLQFALKKLKSLKFLDDQCRLGAAESSASSPYSQCLSDQQGSVGSDSVCSRKESGKCDSDEVIKGMPIGSEDGIADDVSGCSFSDSLPQEFACQGQGSETEKSHYDDESRFVDDDVNAINQEPAIVAFRKTSSGNDKQLDQPMHEDEDVDNTLALVPVGKPVNSETSKPKCENNVQDVLLALRKVKEELLYTMQRKADVYSQKEIMNFQRNIYGASLQCHKVSY